MTNHHGVSNDIPVATASRTKTKVSRRTEELQASYGKLPLNFEINEGQADSDVMFISRGMGYGLLLTPTEAVLVTDEPAREKRSGLSGRTVRNHEEKINDVLRMRLIGANAEPRVIGNDLLPGKSNYFIGNDPKKWHTNVKQYAKVQYQEVYPGIDMVYFGNQRQLEYSFIVGPNADPNLIRLGFAGARCLDIARNGDLILTLRNGKVRQHRPFTYQMIEGHKREITSRYRITRKHQVAIEFGAYDQTRELVIDPVITYSTFLGGSGGERGLDIDVDSGGNAYVTGTTSSANFPVRNSTQSYGGGIDAFVTKINPAASVTVYSTYIVGNSNDFGFGIKVDATGNAFVAGATSSTNFPTANAFQSTAQGLEDAFVLKLSPTGDALIYSTYLGGSSHDFGNDIALDGTGCAYIAGSTESSNFPTVNPYDASYNSPELEDGFVTKLSSSGSSLVYSTFLGGSLHDEAFAITVDAQGNAYVTGYTSSANFPIVAALYPTIGSNGVENPRDAFVTKFNATGETLVFSTFLGGDSSGDTGQDIALDSSGNIYVTGEAGSGFPILNAYQPTLAGSSDAFVTKMNPSATALIYSTYLGGSGQDVAYTIAVDSFENVYIAGITLSTNFPRIRALQSFFAGGPGDCLIAKFDAAGVLTFSTYLGTAAEDFISGIVVDAASNAYLAGSTVSSTFPTVGSMQPYGGSGDAVIIKLTGLLSYSISGRITDAVNNGLSAVTVTITGSQSGTTQTDASGNYTFADLPAAGNYTVTPSKSPYIFVPSNRTFNSLSANQIAHFTVSIVNISGNVVGPGNTPVSGVTLSLAGTQTGTTQTDANGNYSFPAVAAGGSYTLTPTKPDPLLTYSFTPATQALNNLSANQTANFVAAASIISPLYPTADAHVQDGSFANTNFGTITPIRLQTDSKTNNGKNFDGYFKFDVGAVGGNITSVKFRIFAALSAAGSVNTAVYSVADTQWLESGTNSLTWNNKPPKSPNALPGATATINSTTSTSYDFDITAYVKNEKSAGRDVISLGLHNPSASSLFINLNSREAATNKPQLIVTVDNGPNAAPSVSLTNPLNGAALTGPTNINLSANASDSDGSITKVEFFAGSTSIGVITTAPYQMVWPNVPIGSYSLTAIATDNLSTSTVSSAVNISVNPANSLPSVSLTSPLQGTILAANSNITLNATASDDDGTISSVEFFSGSTSLGIDNTSPYSITWNNIPPGVHSLTARATDNNGGQMTSPALSVNVVWQTGFSAAADAYVKDGSTAATNFGTATELQLQQGSTGLNRESYLRFDLTAVNGIARAKLRVFGRLSDTSGTNVGVGAYSISSPTSTQWVESSITWNNKPANGTLTLMGTTTVTDNVGRWYEFDVSSHIQSEKIAGRSVVSFALKSQAASNPFITFNSREATGNRPQLVVWTTQARDALLAVGSSNLNAGDTTAKMRLESLGYTVTVKVANNNLNTVDADGKALVVVSSTCNASSVTNKFRHVVVPVVNWEFDVNDDFGMTGTTSGTDFGTTTTAQTQLSITNAGHALASGLSGTVSVVSSGSNFSWGLPNANAAKIATLMSDANKTVIFGYDGGAAMPGLEAPARRVGLFMTDLTAGSFNGNGNALFDAAVKWATEVNTTPTITTVTPGTGPVGTVVTISGSNFGQMQGTSTLSFNSMPATATSWSDRTIVAAVPSYATTGLVVVKVNGVYSNGIAFTVAEIDSDGDGLADWWELQYFGNLTQNANGDPDNDGLTNLQEYQQGRNPTKSALSDTGDFVNLKLYTPLSP